MCMYIPNYLAGDHLEAEYFKATEKLCIRAHSGSLYYLHTIYIHSLYYVPCIFVKK